MWGWQNLLDTTDIYLKINTNGDFICSPYGKLDLIIFKRKQNCPFLDYLQSKYYAILGYAESCTRWSTTNLVPPHLTTDMAYTVNYAPSPYSVIATSDVILNSNLATQSFKQEYDTILQTMTATIDNKKEKKDMNFFKNFEFGPVKNDTVRLSPLWTCR